MSHAIGIDLGTTNTVVAAVVDGVAVTLEDEQKRRLLPSIVSFPSSGNVLVGDSARARRLLDPENTIFSVKPLMGRPFDSEEIQLARGRFPFKLACGPKNSTMVLAGGVGYGIPEISAFVLRRAKAIAERALGETVDRAVITVPANFNDLQRAATKTAGKLAGLEVLRILNEPTAAALAYGQSIAKAEKIAVYDLGGGTFDITLLDLTGNVFEVLATAGDTALGGDDVDTLVAEHIAREVLRRFKIDPRVNPASFARLRVIAEEAKKALSSQRAVDHVVSGIGNAPRGAAITMPMTITQGDLDRLALPLIERTLSVTRHSIELVDLKAEDFDRVILVGGATRMPLVPTLVGQLFGRAPHLKVNPDEVVALGAAIQAHALNRSKIVARRRPVDEATPAAQDAAAQAVAPQGAVTGGRGEVAASLTNASAQAFVVDVPPAAGIPADVESVDADIPRSIAFSKAAAVITFSPPPPSPNLQGRPPPPADRRSPPDLALGDASVGPRVSAGAPLGGAMATAEGRSSLESASSPRRPLFEGAFARGSAIATSADAPLLIDVTPLSLRVETVGGYSDVLIAANSPVPCEKARTFLTASDNQTVVFIRVGQGEAARFADNTRLGELELSGLKPGKRGEVKILVTFELDADGILNVRAKDKDTLRETKSAMRLLGASTDAAEMGEMVARQARHDVV